MAILNATQCSTNLKNTGICDCPFDPKLIVGEIKILKTRVLTVAELNDIQVTLEGLVEAVKASRVYPVQGFVAVTDGSEEPTFQTFGYGSQVPVREGKYNWTFQFYQGGLQKSNALRSFNASSYASIFIDSENTLIGTKKLDVNGEDGLAGVPMEGGYPYTYPWKVNDGTNTTAYRTQYVFQPSYVNENIAFFQVPKATYLLTELAGLQDVTLKIVATDDLNDDLTIKAYGPCGEDLYDTYADELNQVTAWIGSQGGVNIVHTVAKDDAAKGWIIVYTTLDLTAGDTWTLAAPTVLAAAPISVSGYESNTVTVAVGS